MRLVKLGGQVYITWSGHEICSSRRSCNATKIFIFDERGNEVDWIPSTKSAGSQLLPENATYMLWIYVTGGGHVHVTVSRIDQKNLKLEDIAHLNDYMALDEVLDVMQRSGIPVDSELGRRILSWLGHLDP